MNTKRKPTGPKVGAPALSADSCPVAALMRPAALQFQARGDAKASNDDFVVEQVDDAFEALTSLATSRQARSLLGAAFQLTVGLRCVDSAVCGPDQRTRERAHRETIRALSSAYKVVIAAAGIAPDEIIVGRLLGTDAFFPECVEAAFAPPCGPNSASPREPIKPRYA